VKEQYGEMEVDGEEFPKKNQKDRETRKSIIVEATHCSHASYRE